MGDDASQGAPDAAVDNDVLLKASCYGLAAALGEGRRIAVLGAARFVIAGRIPKLSLNGDAGAACAAALQLIEASVELEPTDDELRFATEIELEAQRGGVALDAGESQLAAAVVARSIPIFETGDKRAIRGFEVLLDDIPRLEGLVAKIRCLEQIVSRCAARDSEAFADAVCAEPDVDKALSICFRCFSPRPEGCRLDPDGLASYINSLRADAPRVLTP